jgi:hypothetical protein
MRHTEIIAEIGGLVGKDQYVRSLFDSLSKELEASPEEQKNFSKFPVKPRLKFIKKMP